MKTTPIFGPRSAFGSLVGSVQVHSARCIRVGLPHARQRDTPAFEGYRNNEFGSGPKPSEGYGLVRDMPYADLQSGPNVRAFGQLVAAYAARSHLTEGAVDETGVDLLQGFVDWRLPFGADGAVTLRGGRQVMTYGSERLISARYGPNVLRSFDSGIARWQAATGVSTLSLRGLSRTISTRSTTARTQPRSYGHSMQRGLCHRSGATRGSICFTSAMVTRRPSSTRAQGVSCATHSEADSLVPAHGGSGMSRGICSSGALATTRSAPGQSHGHPLHLHDLPLTPLLRCAPT
jgi:hypothetical protein